jgi:hypothetical protein
MKMCKSLSLGAAFFLLLTVVTGCFCAPPMYTRFYEPISDWEKGEFDKADRSVYPEDVRHDFSQYQSITVAWTGTIEDVQVKETPEGPDVMYLLNHHYYDWIEDFSPRPERILLSPRGEGQFKTTWGLKPGTQLEEFTDPSQLLIVYGIPISLENEVIIIDASYVRGINKRFYTTEVMDYGR